MNYVGENAAIVAAKDYDSMMSRIFEFHTEKLDFYLNVKLMWDVIDGMMIDLAVGGGIFSIPSGMYVMIGDEYGEVDWIKVDELIARPDLTVATLDVEFANWGCASASASNVHDGEIYWPSSKHIIPIQSNSIVILVSEKDQYPILGQSQIEIFTQA